MKMFKLFLISAIITLTLVTQSFAQDSTETDEGWKWEWDDEEWTDWESKNPTISFHYGISELSRKDIHSSFTDNALLELKLGYTTLKTSKFAESLNKYRYNYLFITHNSTNLSGASDSPLDIETNNWRFGFARSSGYGYKIGKNASVIPYFTGSWDWTVIDYKVSSNIDQLIEDEPRLMLYDDAFRFGTSNEGGIRIQATKFITVEAGYERSIVFQRHLFWKWAGSSIIELASHGLLDAFINEIIKSSPETGPIVYFVLKSALGYGIYELRKDKMNWPFTSASPIMFDNVKFGVTFVF
jgi:hypothetical protein